MSETKDLYKDPENVKDIINTVKNCEMHKDFISLINKTFPTWILGWPKKFSHDYPHFQHNWEFVCNKTNSKPTKCHHSQ